MNKPQDMSKEKVKQSSKRIKNIYSEISKGLKQGSMEIEMVRIKLTEAGILIKELEGESQETFPWSLSE